MLECIGRFGPAVGIESDPVLLEAAQQRGLEVEAGALPGDLPVLPGPLDAVCLFDVLEHIEDDAQALAAVRGLLRPGGLLFITVPAYAWLWSAHDERLGHCRRYTAGRLRRAVEGAGFRVRRLTYFNTILALPVMVLRLLGRALGREAHDLRRPGTLLNRALAACFALEARLLRWGAFPFGISILMVARRPAGRRQAARG